MINISNLPSAFESQSFNTNFWMSIGILVGATFIKLLTKMFVRNVMKRIEDDDPEHDAPAEKRAKTIGGIINSTFNILIYGAAFLMILDQWGVNMVPLLTGAGVLGLAVGFGSQTLVKDIVTGFFVLMENQFNIGDTIEIAGLKGKVLDMKLRTTVLKGQGGETFTVPNSEIKSVRVFK